jgi:hypothetical protein
LFDRYFLLYQAVVKYIKWKAYERKKFVLHFSFLRSFALVFFVSPVCSRAARSLTIHEDSGQEREQRLSEGAKRRKGGGLLYRRPITPLLEELKRVSVY